MAGLDEQTEELDFVAVSPESVASAIVFFGEACASPGLLQSRIEKQKNYLERVSKEIESKQKKRLEILQKWIQELEAANAKQIKAKHEMAILVAEQTAENAKTVHQGNPGFQNHTPGSISDQAAQQTVLSVFKSVRSLDAKHGVPRRFGTAHGGWRD